MLFMTKCEEKLISGRMNLSPETILPAVHILTCLVLTSAAQHQQNQEL
jgi:hypothetical protein